MVTKVFKYAVSATFRTPDLVMQQIVLSHRLRNALVEVEHNYLTQVQDIFRQHPAVAAAEAALEQAVGALEQLVAEVRHARIANQSKEATPEAKAAVKAAKAALTPLRKTYKEAKAAAKGVLDEQLKTAATSRMTERVAARAKAVEDGLFWATATDVLRKAIVAEKLVANAWRNGTAAGRRFKRFDGSGTITTQIMWNSGMPHLTPDLLAQPNSPRRNVFTLLPHITPEQWDPAGGHKQKAAMLRLQVASGPGNVVEIPVFRHRPLPADCEIKQVQLTRRRVGTQIRHWVTVTVNLPDPQPKEDGLPFSIVLGWKSDPDHKGFIRVARIRSEFCDIRRELFPEDLLDVLHPSKNPDDAYVDVAIPPTWRVTLERGASIRGYRDDLLDVIRPHVMRALQNRPGLAEQLGVAPADVAKWRAARRFSQLALQWPDGDVLDEQLHRDLYTALVEVNYRGASQEERDLKRKQREEKLSGLSTLKLWRLRDRHLEDYGICLTRKVLERRRHKWRVLAAWLCSIASAIALDAPGVAELKRIPAVEDGDSRIAKQGRIQSQIAAPGELAAVIRHAAALRGVPVEDARSED